MNEADYLSFIVDRMRRCFDVKKIILFGSRSKGTASIDSDFDVLVIAETNIPFIKRQGLAMVALGKHEYPVDLLVYTPMEAELAATVLGSAVYWAEKEGKVYLA